jgi:26S proteasome regulatory subunit N5
MSGEIIKADKDFTKEVDAALPEAEKQAQNGQVQAAVEKLLALEKQTRQSSDLASTSRVIVAIVTICKDSGDWSLLNEQVQVLSRPSQRWSRSSWASLTTHPILMLS